MRSNDSPLRYSVLIGGTSHTYLHEVDMIGKKIISSIRIEERFCRKGCFLPNDHLMLQKEDKVVIRTKLGSVAEWKIRLDDSSQFQYFAPCLITNDQKTIFISKLEA